MTNDTPPFSLEDRRAIVEIADAAGLMGDTLHRLLQRLKEHKDADLSPKRARQLEKAVERLSQVNWLCEEATD